MRKSLHRLLPPGIRLSLDALAFGLEGGRLVEQRANHQRLAVANPATPWQRLADIFTPSPFLADIDQAAVPALVSSSAVMRARACRILGKYRIGSTLVEYLRSIEPLESWSPTPTHLYETLTERAGLRAKQKSWPHSPRGMRNTLRHLAPALRAIGIHFDQGSGTGHHDRSYHFYRVGKKAPNAPNAPKPSNDAGSAWAHRKSEAPNVGASHGDTPKPREAPTDAPTDAPTPQPSNGAGSSDFGADLGASGAFSTTLPKEGEG